MRTTHTVYLALWILVTAALLKNSMGGPTSMFKSKRNSTSNENKGLTPQASIGIPRRLPSPWGGKFPIRGRPRHRTSTTTAPSTTFTEPPTTIAAEPETEVPINATENELSFRRRMDIFDISASENPLSVVWPSRSRQSANKRFRIPTPTTPAPQVLLKLLQPKPTRPAIYSLDGFVPKPSIQRIVSTEAPLNFKKTDLQLLSSVPRRRKINRYSKEEDDDDDYQYERRRRKKPVSRYTAFARKGVPGEDYPVYTYIPVTDFDCGAQPGPGLYADPFTDCQVWHMCPGGNLSPRHSFLCPNGTIFNQKKRICDWWYNVDCRKHSRKIRSNDVEGQGIEDILG